MIAVSACLTGVRCRYDGSHSRNERVMKLFTGEGIVPICPEQLGGLPTPRPPAEMIGGDGADVLDGRAKVVDAEGKNITGQFLKGADGFLKTVKLGKFNKTILKEKSPSCGVNMVYRNSVLIPGRGVLTALLQREGVEVVSDEEI